MDEGAIDLQSPATVALAREVARQAVVVLENRGVLPLDPARGQRIAARSARPPTTRWRPCAATASRCTSS